MLVEGGLDKGRKLLEIHQLAASVSVERRGCANGGKALHEPLLELHQVGAPVSKRLGERPGRFGRREVWQEPK